VTHPIMIREHVYHSVTNIHKSECIFLAVALLSLHRFRVIVSAAEVG